MYPKIIVLLLSFSFVSMTVQAEEMNPAPNPLHPVKTTTTNTNEKWKGITQTAPFEMGAMAGMNLYGSDVNWSMLATAAYLIDPQGWVDDVDERVWAELQIGPAFFSRNSISATGLQYSTHLRWDFTYNESWTLYGLGGLSGFKLPSLYGGSFTIHPRFGVGAEFQTKTVVILRAELSHEFIGAGLSFRF